VYELRLKHSPEGIDIACRQSWSGVHSRVRVYVLAAGALSSPVLLLRTGLDRPLVGRNYMFHL
jgi:hypothetical protein